MTTKPLLLHSLSELDAIIFGLIDRAKPKSILEIGSEAGGFSKQLHTWCEANGAELVTVEPLPSKPIIALAMKSKTFHLHVDKSISHLLAKGCSSDIAIIDGDHNWFTVYNELTLIAKSWTERGTSGTIVLHDVSWPCARRDMYYDPSAIPPEALHPHTYNHGITPGHDGLVNGGYRGEGAFAWAMKEGGPCNGVLTAIEDFMADNRGWTYRSINAVLGLGVLTRTGSNEDAIAAEVMAPYQNPLITTLEENRLALYLKVIELQDTLNAILAAVAAKEVAA